MLQVGQSREYHQVRSGRHGPRLSRLQSDCRKRSSAGKLKRGIVVILTKYTESIVVNPRPGLRTIHRRWWIVAAHGPRPDCDQRVSSHAVVLHRDKPVYHPFQSSASTGQRSTRPTRPQPAWCPPVRPFEHMQKKNAANPVDATAAAASDVWTGTAKPHVSARRAV